MFEPPLCEFAYRWFGSAILCRGDWHERRAHAPEVFEADTAFEDVQGIEEMARRDIGYGKVACDGRRHRQNIGKAERIGGHRIIQPPLERARPSSQRKRPLRGEASC